MRPHHPRSVTPGCDRRRRCHRAAVVLIFLATGCGSVAAPPSTEQVIDVTAPSVSPSTTPPTTTTIPPTTTTTINPASMTVERLRNSTVVVPFTAASDTGSTTLVGGLFEDECCGVRMFVDEGQPASPVIVDINGDGANDAVVAISRYFPVSNRSVVAVISDDQVIAHQVIDYDGTFADGPVRPGIKALAVNENTIEVVVTANFTFPDAPTQTQTFVVGQGGLVRL